MNDKPKRYRLRFRRIERRRLKKEESEEILLDDTHEDYCSQCGMNLSVQGSCDCERDEKSVLNFPECEDCYVLGKYHTCKYFKAETNDCTRKEAEEP